MNPARTSRVADSDALASWLALDALGRLPRVGWRQRGLAPDESVAAHAHGAALLALVLGARVRPALDVGRAVSLVVLHDAPEALLGDLPRRAKALLPAGAKRSAETAAIGELFGDDPAIAALWTEFCDEKTREARFARACDALQLGIQLVTRVRAGARAMDDFEAGLRALDLTEFEPCAALQAELLAALAAERER